ncbi:MAG: hypothetical protein ACOZFS_00700 [Thermodesulfobacteriota bacterium]
MEDEIKVRFEELDKRLASAEKRFDDIKWYFGGVTGVFMIVFSLLTIILSWNYKGERDSLREFQKDIKTELGKVESPPEIELLGTNGSALANQEMEVTFGRELSVRSSWDPEGKEQKGNIIIFINFFLRNAGNASSGPLNLKLYTNEPIKFKDPTKSTDEPKFQYETYLLPQYFVPNELPGRYSCDLRYGWTMDTATIPPNGKYPALIKVFYGKGKIAQAHFTIVITEKQRMAPPELRIGPPELR